LLCSHQGLFAVPFFHFKDFFLLPYMFSRYPL